ncbi:MAG: hypothetical protein Q9207_003850 [Kuettlingeria erythrocarpa]
MPSIAKTSSAMRRASSGLAKVSTPPSSSRTTKGSKASRVVCLKLPSKALARFAQHTPDSAPSPTPLKKLTPDASTTTPPAEEARPVLDKAPPSSPPAETTSSSTPQPPSKDPTGKVTAKASSPKTGSKRGLGAAVDGTKARARPGPKKKSKLDDANGDNTGSAVKGSSGNAIPAHKLGPKANQGAINAGLRALDRTGKPCRKWQKSGFRLKTFTGVPWEIPSWRAPTKSLDAETGPEKGSLPTSNSQSKENNSSSHVGSENSSATPNARVKEDPANSPLLAMAMAT